LGLPKAYKAKIKTQRPNSILMCKASTLQPPPPKKIALLVVGPPKHNLLLKVDLEEVSHNFLVTRAFCSQGIVTIGTPCLFACY
jgi:hypothetical protein